jgi:hypothetical protein
MDKVIEISLIENSDKKKKSADKSTTLIEYKKKIINDLEDVISIKYFKNKNPEQIKQSNLFVEIRNKFVNFYNAYIELNGLFMDKNEINSIVKDIIDDLVKTVIFRAEKLDITEKDVKEIEVLSQILNMDEKKNIIKVDMTI